VQFEPKVVLGLNEARFEVVDVLDESSPSKGDFYSIRKKQGLNLFLSRENSE